MKIVIVLLTIVLIALFDILLPEFAPTHSDLQHGQFYGTGIDFHFLSELNQNISQQLSSLIQSPFFRIFKINLKKECSFWAQQRLCSSNKCSICECTEEEIPEFWKNQTSQDGDLLKKDSVLESEQGNCTEKEATWCIDDEDDANATFVNLATNQEAYTAFEGVNVWKAIYQENCLLDLITEKSIDKEQQCSEETLLFQLISGLHSSINMHIAYNFYDIKSEDFDPDHPEKIKNYWMYYHTIGKHSERIKNLHFLYSFTLSAITRLKDDLFELNLQTGVDKEQDKQANVDMQELLKKLTMKVPEELINHHSGEDRVVMEKRIQEKVENISRIMDCISCEKCKLNGKVQVIGLGAALKVLFFKETDPAFTLKSLKRSEIIALFNLMEKCSDSLLILQEFMEMEQTYHQQLRFCQGFLILMFLLILLDHLWPGKKKSKIDKDKKQK